MWKIVSMTERVYSEEVVEVPKTLKVKKPKVFSEEHRKNLRLSRLGKKHSSETKEKMVKERSGKKRGSYNTKYKDEEIIALVEELDSLMTRVNNIRATLKLKKVNIGIVKNSLKCK